MSVVGDRHAETWQHSRNMVHPGQDSEHRCNEDMVTRSVPVLDIDECRVDGSQLVVPVRLELEERKCGHTTDGLARVSHLVDRVVEDRRKSANGDVAKGRGDGLALPIATPYKNFTRNTQRHVPLVRLSLRPQ